MAKRGRMATRGDRRSARDLRACHCRGGLYGHLRCTGLVAQARARWASGRGPQRGNGMTVLDPIELEVLRNALTAAAAEMDVTMWRTSRSTIVREMLDYSTAIFDAYGNNVAQSARIPQHLNSMGYFMQTILKRFVPAELWEEGDVIISNDPYCGGQHLPDIAAFRPVFFEGKRVAIVGTLCHHLDMGGMSPGSYAANATEIYQEGLRIPPSKLFAKGVRNDVLWGLIAQNVRQP